MKKLPIGIQSFRSLIKGDYLYVDKTAYAEKLISSGKYYFIARPRRFGKSLFVNTLHAILSGDKELFKSCSIYSSGYSFEKHPILHFDFTQIASQTAEDLAGSLKRIILSHAKEEGVNIDYASPQEGLANLVKALSKKGSVAVLIDEYDKPIVDHFDDPEKARLNRNLMRSFFGVLKGLDDHLKFVFVTGVSKFSQVSLFSGFNNLQDLTLDPLYGNMMGYTEQELKTSFSLHLQTIAEKREESIDTLLKQIKHWYNGYLFSYDSLPCYNPHSTLCFFSRGHFHSYWFQTGTPTFLIHYIKQNPYITTELSRSIATMNELLDIREVEDVDFKALMWQTGYLTIQQFDKDKSIFTLDFPNQEVRTAFFESLLKEFAKFSPAIIINHAKECLHDLNTLQLSHFFDRMNQFFAKIPYGLQAQVSEGFYHAIFMSFLEGMGIQTRAEEQTNVGRVDLVLEQEKILFIFEFKLDQSAAIAYEQTEEKRYREKYGRCGKNIAMIGINFSSKERNISEWTGALFSSSGSLLKNLDRGSQEGGNRL
ncbi:MAG: ATP-binding protein [Chlamydiia bacterium]|nr:ATP-binding protein [Chlamydiia bacterium]